MQSSFLQVARRFLNSASAACTSADLNLLKCPVTQGGVNRSSWSVSPRGVREVMALSPGATWLSLEEVPPRAPAIFKLF